MKTYVLTVACRAQKGIVASVSGYLADAGCDIIDSSQFTDSSTNTFFMRVCFQSDAIHSLEELKCGFADIEAKFQMTASFRDQSQKMKVIVMVSRFGHCLNDLLYRSRIGALPIDIVAVISNHTDYKKVVVNQEIPFHEIRVTPQNKAEAEARILRIVEDTGAELVVLARYMQILSDDMCRKMSGKIINIHHSFLPSFKGANPYKQAFERGVMLIGATAHYVTPDLDEGPIIGQDVARVSHRDTPDQMVTRGRDIERLVLSSAVKAHAEDRIFLLDNARTVVFD